MTKQNKNEMQKFLTFLCGELELAVNLEHVSEIIMSNLLVTKVPTVPDYMLGIMNLRGKVVPIIDTSILLNRETRSEKQECIIILDVNEENIGLLVDVVCQITDISQENIAPMPQKSEESKYLCGIISIGDNSNFILDCEKIYN